MLERNIGDLAIERGETGFIVYEKAGQGLLGKKWAFETPEKLAEFVTDWGNKEAKKDTVGESDD